MEQVPLVLLAALQFMGVSVLPGGSGCLASPLNMGEYNVVQNTLTVCVENAKKEDVKVDRIVRHEMVHAIHQRYRLGLRTLTPEPLFTTLVRDNLPSEEVLMVLQGYDRALANQELEARLLEKVMNNDEIAALGVASEAYFEATQPGKTGIALTTQ